MKQRHKMKRESPKVQHNIKRKQSITETSSVTCDTDGGRDWNISEDLDVSRGVDKESSYRDNNDKAQASQEGSHRPPVLTLNPRVLTVCNFSKRNANDIIKSDVKLVAVKSVIERNLTIMMFAASMVFILCFAPYFMIRVIMRVYLGIGIDFEMKTGSQFALLLPILNSVFNPVFYCVFNPDFRKFLKCGF
ncbi:5-hydroxytryptamine receptor 1A-like [Mercenaria mercenaria]|uniref:5-hydroxytryptamine receptor 1A-like n=1 Tax=Mercenaria mercenaria TaxID=6596 RepID=UPI00234EE27A|nr:5-hydroxytryptamine receptor 1A-like [Mercenaria mercenaria]